MQDLTLRRIAVLFAQKNKEVKTMIQFAIGVAVGVVLTVDVVSVLGCIYLERQYPELRDQLRASEEARL